MNAGRLPGPNTRCWFAVVAVALVLAGLPGSLTAQEVAVDTSNGVAEAPSIGQALSVEISPMGLRNVAAVPADDADAAPAAPAVSSPGAPVAAGELTIPRGTGVSGPEYARRKAAAASAAAGTVAADASTRAQANAPAEPSEQAPSAPATTDARAVDSAAVPFTAAASSSFAGLSDAANIGLLGFRLQPSDQALATNGRFVLQAVNDVITLTNTVGATQPGFPRTLASFFGVPRLACLSGFGPFLGDPRAFMDPGTGRFWVMAMEREGFGRDPNANCPNISRLWVAVSQTTNPAGPYFIFAFNSAFFGGWADYPTFGFDNNGIYLGTNQFSAAGAFLGSVFGACNKFQMAAGATPACAFRGPPSMGGVLVDTLQPVLNTGDRFTGWPQTEFFVNSFNLRFGGGQCLNGCSGLVVWSFHYSGGATADVTGVVIPSAGYALAPFADNPGACVRCIDTLDTRISATPVYRAGSIWAALETRVSNGTQIVPAIVWVKIRPALNEPSTGFAILGNTNVDEQGYFFFGGNGAAYFGALMPDAEGNVVMVFNFSGLGFVPEAAYVSKRAVNQIGSFQDRGLCLGGCRTAPPTFDGRWGDYSATAYAAPFAWIATQTTAANGDWATQIGRLRFSPSTP